VNEYSFCEQHFNLKFQNVGENAYFFANLGLLQALAKRFDFGKKHVAGGKRLAAAVDSNLDRDDLQHDDHEWKLLFNTQQDVLQREKLPKIHITSIITHTHSNEVMRSDLLHPEQPANTLSDERVLGVNLTARIARAAVQLADVVKQQSGAPQTMRASVLGDVVAVVPAK
jgi:hypothetical protein